MSTYKGQTPSNTSLDPRIVSFFERFYAVSDDPDAHEEYAQSFTPDADFTMGTRKVAGYKDILALRHGLWSGPVETRKHTLHKIFPFGPDAHEVMLYGSVDYRLKNGKHVSVDWAGRAVLAEHQGELRMNFYQVYLVSTSLLPYMLRVVPALYPGIWVSKYLGGLPRMSGGQESRGSGLYGERLTRDTKDSAPVTNAVKE